MVKSRPRGRDLGRPRPSAMTQPLRTTSPGHEPASSAGPSAARSRAQARKRRAATTQTTHKPRRAEHASTAKRDPRARSEARTRGPAEPPPAGRATPHTGAWLEKERLELALQKEYFEEGPPKLLVPDTMLPAGLRSTQDQREAARALRGSMLRQEVYAEDGSELEKNPYVITEQNFAVRVLQSSQLGRQSPVAREHHGVFFTHPREAVSIHTERHPDDPRVTHQFTLDVDDFGNVTREAAVAYARADAPHAEQGRTWATLAERRFVNRPGPTNPNDPDPENHWYRIGVEYEEKTFELTTLPALETGRSEEHTSELQSRENLVCRLL